MTRPSLPFYLFLTSVLCGALSGCGGDRPATGVYTGEAPESRMGGEAHVNTPLLSRVAKLEGEMAVMRNDLSQLAMTYNGLMTTNERLDSLLAKMEEGGVAAPAPAVERAAAVPSKTPVKAAPAAVIAAPAVPTVIGVRLGEHPDKTRLVIDWRRPGEVRTDLDNAEKLLIVTLSKTAWEAKTLVSGLSSPLVAGWTVQEDGDKRVLAIQLKKPVKILAVGRLKAEGDQPGRIVIDLAAS